jgi:hypothetical protein
MGTLKGIQVGINGIFHHEKVFFSTIKWEFNIQSWHLSSKKFGILTNENWMV